MAEDKSLADIISERWREGNMRAPSTQHQEEKPMWTVLVKTEPDDEHALWIHLCTVYNDQSLELLESILKTTELVYKILKEESTR